MGRAARVEDIEVRVLSTAISPGEADRRLADLLRLLMDFRRADEATGHRFIDRDGRTLQPLRHED